MNDTALEQVERRFGNRAQRHILYGIARACEGAGWSESAWFLRNLGNQRREGAEDFFTALVEAASKKEEARSGPNPPGVLRTVHDTALTMHEILLLFRDFERGDPSELPENPEKTGSAFASREPS